MVFKVKGRLDFNPENKTEKHRSQSVWKRTAMIRTDCDMDRYYAWFLKKRFNLELNGNLRGNHVTFIADRLDEKTFNEASKIFNGKEIEFFVEIEPRSNGEHWWLRVYSPEAESIREVLGLSREPHFGMHLTLGRATPKCPEDLNDKVLMELKWRLNTAKYKNNIEDIKSLEERIKAYIDDNNKFIGLRVSKDFIEHSNYIYETCKSSNILSSTPRISLSEQKIVK